MTADRRNLVLTGYMGTGKSSVGQRVAQVLDRSFVDMDALIVEREGMSIPDIFRERGEDAFRRLERELCQELSARGGLVIATGGGTLVSAENRRPMEDGGCVICLDCAPDELVKRLGQGEGRPMLRADDPAERMRELLSARRPAYAQIPHHVDTTDLSIDQVVERVLNIFRADPTVWRVTTPTGGYQIHLHPGGLYSLGALLRIRDVRSRLVVVSDENVWPLYGEAILESLRGSCYDPAYVVVPAGEENKTLETTRTLYDRFVDANLDRGGAVVAVGGGVITDMAGFAAATFMRGIPLVQVPTTLLGMIDASVGGKVAVDHPQGKNLIGQFVTPLLVMLDPDTLKTLPEIEFRSGLAEVIKAGIIGDPELFASLESKEGARDLRGMVGCALKVKIDVVEEDPYEQGRRAVLNLGHTFAHAFEVLADYGLRHGLAVSTGMVVAAHLGEIRGLCSASTRERIEACLRCHDLPITYDAQPPAAVYEAMATDKKRRGSRLRFIVPRDIGDVVIDGNVPRDQVLLALERTRP
ncbi:MAG: 3-dehydroquinate synthase [Chloroflexota bacterium]|nr:3-dehydroquinate synthase [Chloroflexota bacterium]